MNSKEFFTVLAGDLQSANLTAAQVKQALLYNVTKEQDKQLIEEIVNKKFASWIPSGMIAEPGAGYDADQQSSYQARGERVNAEDPVVEDIDEEEVVASSQKKNELIRLLKETADLADKRGFSRQADFLDDLLLTLTEENPRV